MRPARLDRFRRGLIAATIATFVALLSHVTAGGMMPGLLGVLVPWILAVTVCTLVLGCAWGAIRLSAAVVVSQALFHGLFVLGTVTPSGVVGAEHQHGMMPMPMPHEAAAASSPLLLPHASMLLGHGIAAVLTILALRRGERTIAALTRFVASLLTRIAAVFRTALPPVRDAAPRLHTAVWQLRAPRADPSISPRSLRGPPALAVA